MGIPIVVQGDRLRTCLPTILCSSGIEQPSAEGRSSPTRERVSPQSLGPPGPEGHGFPGPENEHYAIRPTARTSQVPAWS